MSALGSAYVPDRDPEQDARFALREALLREQDAQHELARARLDATQQLAELQRELA